MFGNNSVEYWGSVELSGKLRRVFGAQPGNEEIKVTVVDVQPRFEEEIMFWKTCFGIAE
jgi:hypothetical protein